MERVDLHIARHPLPKYDPPLFQDLDPQVKAIDYAASRSVGTRYK